MYLPRYTGRWMDGRGRVGADNQGSKGEQGARAKQSFPPMLVMGNGCMHIQQKWSNLEMVSQEVKMVDMSWLTGDDETKSRRAHDNVENVDQTLIDSGRLTDSRTVPGYMHVMGSSQGPMNSA